MHEVLFFNRISGKFTNPICCDCGNLRSNFTGLGVLIGYKRIKAFRWFGLSETPTRDRDVGLEVTDNSPYETTLGFYLQSIP